MQIGFGNLSKAFNAIPRKSKSHKDLKFNTPIEELQGNVEAGYYPPPEVMIAISRCFKNYLNGRGNISLDEAFFGDPIARGRVSLTNKVELAVHLNMSYLLNG